MGAIVELISPRGKPVVFHTTPKSRVFVSGPPSEPHHHRFQKYSTEHGNCYKIHGSSLTAGYWDSIWTLERVEVGTRYGLYEGTDKGKPRKRRSGEKISELLIQYCRYIIMWYSSHEKKVTFQRVILAR